MKNAMQANRWLRKEAEDRLRQVAKRIEECLAQSDAEAVHALRVEIRRCKQALEWMAPRAKGDAKGDDAPRKTIETKTIETKISEANTNEIKTVQAKLDHLFKLAGEVRDRDLALYWLEKYAGAPSQTESGQDLPCLHQMRTERLEAALELKRALQIFRGEEWPALLARVDETIKPELVESGVDQKDRARQADAKILKRLAREYVERGQRAARQSSTPKELHKFRIFTKKFRYTLELFQPLYGAGLQQALSEARGVQSLLGDANDQMAVRDLIKDSGYAGSAALQRKLKNAQRRKIKRFRREWKQRLGRKGQGLAWRRTFSRDLSS